MLREIAPGSSFKWVGYALIAAAIALLFLCKLRPLWDTDVFLHLAVGETILDKHEIPRTGLYSATRGDAPWIDNEWGFQVLAASVNRLLGVRGLVLLGAFLPGLAALVLAVALRLRGLSPAAVAATIGLIAWALGLVNFRPQLVTYVFLTAFLAGMAALVENRSRAPMWILPPLAMIWANMHAGFIMGLTVLAIAVAVETVRRIARRAPAVPLGALASTLALCTGATFLNPYGWHQVIYPITYLLRPQMTASNTEWLPITPATVPGFELLLGVTFLLLIFAPRRPSLHDVALLLAFVAFGFSAWRHLGLVTLVAPYAAAPSAAALLDRAFVPGDRTRRLLTVALAGLTLVATFSLGGGFPEKDVFHYDRSVTLPVEAANFIAEHHPPGKLFNEYVWGGYLIYRFKPEPVVFVDGRNDLYPPEFMTDFKRTQSGAPGYDDVLDRQGVGSVLLAYMPQNGRLIRKLVDSGWVCVHRSEAAVPIVLIVRPTEESRALIAGFGMPLDPP